MPRIIILKDKKPYELKTDGATLLICKCGLTKSESGLCDDACAKTHDEDDKVTYMYMEHGREEVDLVGDEGFDDDMDMFGQSGCCGGSDSCGCGSHSDSVKDEQDKGGCGCHNLHDLHGQMKTDAE